MSDSKLSDPLVLQLEQRIRSAQLLGDIEAVQDGIDALDQALSVGDSSSEAYASGFHELRRWCRTSGLLPSTCIVREETVALYSTTAFSCSALSDVYRGRIGDHAIAVKSIRLHANERDDILKSFRCEAATWRCLRHPNIVPFLGVSKISDYPVCLLSQWMSEGTICAFFRQRPREHRAKYIEGIINGLQYIHSLNVIHGDIKSANILVDADHTARLSDFGIAKILYESPTAATTLTGGGQGTCRWMAPELLEPPDESEQFQLSFASDVYAFSITLWELFTTRTPYPDVRHDYSVTLRVLRGDRPDRPSSSDSQDVGLHERLWDTMESGWDADPLRRPSLAAFLAAVWKENQGSAADWLEVDFAEILNELKRIGEGWRAVYNPSTQGQPDVGLVHTLRHDSVVCCVRFSPNGKLLATGSNRMVQIFEVGGMRGRRLCVLNDLGHFAGDLYFRSLDFSPDASVVAAGAEDARIRIWNLTTRHMICTLDGHTQDIYSLRFSSHGRFLASGSGDGTVRIWDVPDQDTAYTWPKQQARVLTGPPDADGCVWSVAVSPNNQLVAGGSLDSTVRIWHAQTGALLHVITGHSNSVYSVVFTHDGCGLISGSQDKSLKYWDIRELAQLSPNAVMSRVRLLDVGRALRQIRKHHEPSSIDFLGHKDIVLSTTLTSNGKWLVSASKDCALLIWDPSDAQLHCRIVGHSNSVISVDSSAHGDMIASGSGDCLVRGNCRDPNMSAAHPKGRRSLGEELTDDGKRVEAPRSVEKEVDVVVGDK